MTVIRITSKAQDYLKDVVDNEDEIVKLGIAGGGCSGFQYEWNIISKDTIDEMSDEVLNFENGGGLVIDGMSLMYLFGSEIDLESNLQGTKLTVANPQVSNTCGCGESITIDTTGAPAGCPKMDDYDESMFYDPSMDMDMRDG